MTKEEMAKAYADGFKDKDFQQIAFDAFVCGYTAKCESLLPSNLDEAAEKFANTQNKNFLKPEIVKNIFKAGAKWTAEQGVSLSHLIAWYIQSVDAHEPVWTKEHLEELVKDYILIPKN